MTTYPSTDPRRWAALRAYLGRLAPALTPDWAPTGDRDDFGSALLEIAARLAEETTWRLDRTAQRDAMAFFDFLGLPPTPPRAATGILVMALAEKHADPVSAAARTQVVVDSDVTFETQEELRVVPGGIGALLAVDPATDRIEQAPAQVSSTAPPTVQPGSYQVLTFAASGSPILQLSPAVGLTAGDMLRVGGSAYRVATVEKTGLVTLQDPLEAPVAAGDTVTKIVSLEAFNLRDLQRHGFMIGHKELFSLDQRAVISVSLAPSGLARELSRLDIAYSMYGKRVGEDQPGWHDLDLLGTKGQQIELAKSWLGATDEFLLSGQKSRWVRAELRGPVTGSASLTARASQVSVGVKSLANPTSGGGSESAPQEGSRTIARAAHNGTPLSTARRFFPFGPEPLRFDIFAIAAPESLSKKGADVTVDIKMADASLTSFEITSTITGAAALGGYGRGSNGYLEVLSTNAAGAFRWQELPLVDPHGKPLLLGAPPIGVALPGQGIDLVVIRERGGGLWAARLTRADSQVPASVGAEGWQQLSPLTGEGSGRPIALPAPAGAAGVTAVLLDAAQGALHALLVNDYGLADPAGWQPVQNNDEAPSFVGDWQILPVQGAGWPARPAGAAMEIVVVDGAGAVWLGAAETIKSGQQVALSWHRFDVTASADVRPAATRFPAEGGGESPLWISYAAPHDQDRRLRGVIHGAAGSRHIRLDATVMPRQPLHTNPAIMGIDGHPVTVGLGSAPGQALVWLGADQVLTVPLGAVTPTTGPLLLQTAPAELVLPGEGERLFRTPVALPLVDYTLHDVVPLDTPQVAHWLEITTGEGDPALSAMVALTTPRIKQGNLRVYQIDQPRLELGQTILALRLLAPTGGALTGGFADPADRSAFQLAGTDTTTRVGTRLIIGNASYPVTALSAGVATLRFPVRGSDAAPQYRPTEELTRLDVSQAHRRTLAELRPGTGVASSVTLQFGTPADPSAQESDVRQTASGVTWALLPAGWRVAPPDQGRAVVLAEHAEGPTWAVDAFQRGYQNPELSWEYFDGQGWRALNGLVDGTANLSTSGDVHFTVPGDLSTTDIGGKDDYWIRARLIGGDYGRPSYAVHRHPIPGGDEVQTVTVDTSALRPPEILAIEARFNLSKQIPPEIVLVENNLDILNETQAAAAARFELFQGALALESPSAADPGDAGRALYVGLTAAIGAGSVTFLADAADQDGTSPLRVDVRTADGWERVIVDDDRTQGLRRRGMITLSLAEDPIALRLFGHERVWLRLRPEPADASWAPVVRRLLVNAVAITQARTVPNEILGSSLGEPGLTLELAEQPVLPDTVELRVREDLSDQEKTQLQARSPGEQVVRTDPDRFPGSWVLWRRVDSLIGCAGDARVYVLDPPSGRVRFGDGRTGRIPPAGRDNIRCFTYQQGGGPTGNVKAWKDVRLTSAVEGVETVLLPIDTAGGYGAPAAESLFATAPDRLRHAGRAMSTADIEAIAVGASADIVRALCASPAGAGEPIRVTIAVRDDGTRCPVPTLAQRDAVAAAIREAGWGGLGENGIAVSGPVYVPVAVTANLVAPRDRLAEVEHAAKDTLTKLLNPVAGGRDGAGWPFGQRPTTGDLLRALSEVPGLDRVGSVDVTAPDGGPLDLMPADGLVCAKVADIHVVVTPVEGTS